MEKLATSLNVPLDLLKTVSLMLASIPLAFGFRFINNINMRYLYSLLMGLIFLFTLLE